MYIILIAIVFVLFTVSLLYWCNYKQVEKFQTNFNEFVDNVERIECDQIDDMKLNEIDDKKYLHCLEPCENHLKDKNETNCTSCAEGDEEKQNFYEGVVDTDYCVFKGEVKRRGDTLSNIPCSNMSIPCPICDIGMSNIVNTEINNCISCGYEDEPYKGTKTVRVETECQTFGNDEYIKRNVGDTFDIPCEYGQTKDYSECLQCKPIDDCSRNCGTTQQSTLQMPDGSNRCIYDGNNYYTNEKKYKAFGDAYISSFSSNIICNECDNCEKVTSTCFQTSCGNLQKKRHTFTIPTGNNRCKYIDSDGQKQYLSELQDTYSYEEECETQSSCLQCNPDIFVGYKEQNCGVQQRTPLYLSDRNSYPCKIGNETINSYDDASQGKYVEGEIEDNLEYVGCDDCIFGNWNYEQKKSDGTWGDVNVSFNESSWSILSDAEKMKKEEEYCGKSFRRYQTANNSSCKLSGTEIYLEEGGRNYDEYGETGIEVVSCVPDCLSNVGVCENMGCGSKKQKTIRFSLPSGANECKIKPMEQFGISTTMYIDTNYLKNMQCDEDSSCYHTWSGVEELDFEMVLADYKYNEFMNRYMEVVNDKLCYVDYKGNIYVHDLVTRKNIVGNVQNEESLMKFKLTREQWMQSQYYVKYPIGQEDGDNQMRIRTDDGNREENKSFYMYRIDEKIEHLSFNGRHIVVSGPVHNPTNLFVYDLEHSEEKPHVIRCPLYAQYVLIAATVISSDWLGLIEFENICCNQSSERNCDNCHGRYDLGLNGTPCHIRWKLCLHRLSDIKNVNSYESFEYQLDIRDIDSSEGKRYYPLIHNNRDPFIFDAKNPNRFVIPVTSDLDDNYYSHGDSPCYTTILKKYSNAKVHLLIYEFDGSEWIIKQTIKPEEMGGIDWKMPRNIKFHGDSILLSGYDFGDPYNTLNYDFGDYENMSHYKNNVVYATQDHEKNNYPGQRGIIQAFVEKNGQFRVNGYHLDKSPNYVSNQHGHYATINDMYIVSMSYLTNKDTRTIRITDSEQEDGFKWSGNGEMYIFRRNEEGDWDFTSPYKHYIHQQGGAACYPYVLSDGSIFFKDSTRKVFKLNAD